MTPAARWVCLALALSVATPCAQAPMSGVSLVHASALLGAPLGECLPRALAQADGSEDLGRVSVDSARYLGAGSSYRSNALQRHQLRLFQSQYETGPRFLDALITEYACGPGRVQLDLTVSIYRSQTLPDDQAVARRLDSLLAHVVASCGARTLSVSSARRTAGLRDPC